MANISSALGKVYINGDWTEKNIKSLIYLLSTQDIGYDYSMYFAEDFEYKLKQLKKYKYLNFNASGKWFFANNLEQLQNWSYLSKEQWTNKLNYNKYLKLRLELFKDMYNNDLKLIWEYNDMEGGVQTITYEEGYHYVDENNDLKYKEIVLKEYEYTLINECNIYYNNTDSLDNYLEGIKDFYELTKEQIVNLKTAILNDPSWFNISAEPIVEILPAELKKLI